MSCFHPLSAYQNMLTKEIVFSKKDVKNNGVTTIGIDRQLQLPCGQCGACRLKRVRDWAVRMHHEMLMTDCASSFITLTYDDDYLPSDGSLNLKHMQDFMKRLRRHIDYYSGRKVKYYYCGEYGTHNTLRPHYHLILFGFRFPDSYLSADFRASRSRFGVKNPLFVSRALSKLWPYGFSTMGDVTFNSAAYVARYVTKKISNSKNNVVIQDKFHLHYGNRLPEFAHMSNGIGLSWIKKYLYDVYPSDFIVVHSKFKNRTYKITPPRYYDQYLNSVDENLYNEVKRARFKRAIENADDNTSERLFVKEQILIERMKRFSRSYEEVA